MVLWLDVTESICSEQCSETRNVCLFVCFDRNVTVAGILKTEERLNLT